MDTEKSRDGRLWDETLGSDNRSTYRTLHIKDKDKLYFDIIGDNKRYEFSI